jgi:hypothetical protein
MPELSVLQLSECQLAHAFPLVRAAARVTSDRWEAFGRELIAAGGGILAIQADDGCLHGLAAFRRCETLRHDVSLQVEILVAFELSRSAPVRRALCEAIREHAKARRCHSIVYTMAAHSHADAASLRRMSWEKSG